MIYTVVLVAHVLIAVGIVGLVLIQHGKGADAGAAFGGGASGTVFGSSGSGNFLSRSTAILATLFFCTSIGLAFLAGSPTSGGNVLDEIVPEGIEAPAADPFDDVPVLPEDDVVSGSDDVPAIPREEGETLIDQAAELVNDAKETVSEAVEEVEDAISEESAPADSATETQDSNVQ